MRAMGISLDHDVTAHQGRSIRGMAWLGSAHGWEWFVPFTIWL